MQAPVTGLHGAVDILFVLLKLQLIKRNVKCFCGVSLTRTVSTFSFLVIHFFRFFSQCDDVMILFLN